MKIYSSNAPLFSPNPDENLWLYNALDCCVTREVFDEIYLPSHEHLFPYTMSRAMQGPALTLMRRGVYINQFHRQEVFEQITLRMEKLEECFNRVCIGAFEQTFNWKSPDQLKQLFYVFLRIPEVTVYDKFTGERRPSVNREALEKIADYLPGQWFVKIILELRGGKKLLDVVKAGADSDGRLRCSYGVAATLSGRWASRKSVFGSGTNLQNITDEMRRMFGATPGMKLAQADLKTAESLVSACLARDKDYFDACVSGDIHTFAAKQMWKSLPWGTERDRSIAERKFYRHFTYRDMAKRGGHLSNYGGTPHIMVKHLHIPLSVAKEFQELYFSNVFKRGRTWHAEVAQQFGATRCITTPLGRRCHFTGRPWENSTLKSAIAYGPQSTVADLLNLALYKLWLKYDNKVLRLLLQVHDAVVFEYDPKDEHWLIPEIAREMVIPLEINSFPLAIPVDIAVGWNWGKRLVTKTGEVINPFGLMDYKGQDDRQYVPEETKKLDRVLCLIDAPQRQRGHISSLVGFGVPIGDGEEELLDGGSGEEVVC